MNVESTYELARLKKLLSAYVVECANANVNVTIEGFARFLNERIARWAE